MMNHNNQNHSGRGSDSGKLTVDDSRLTAFALDEHDLFTADELASIRIAVENDAELQAAVQEIKSVAGMVSQSLHAEPAANDMASLEETVLAGPGDLEEDASAGAVAGAVDHSDTGADLNRETNRVFRYAVPLGMAASLLVALTAVFMMWGDDLVTRPTPVATFDQVKGVEPALSRDHLGQQVGERHGDRSRGRGRGRRAGQDSQQSLHDALMFAESAPQIDLNRQGWPELMFAESARQNDLNRQGWPDTQASDASDGASGIGPTMQGLSLHDGGVDVSHLVANGGQFPEGISTFTPSAYGPTHKPAPVASFAGQRVFDGNMLTTYPTVWMFDGDADQSMAFDDGYFSGGMAVYLDATAARLNPRVYSRAGFTPAKEGTEWWNGVQYPPKDTHYVVPGMYVQPSQEAYEAVIENPFKLVANNPLSTFSIDVDTASYSNVRRYLNQNMIPPPGAVRIEEMINYFDYDYPLPTDEHPFSVNVEVAGCPWNADHRLARIGLKGYEVPANERPSANLVFLIDVSGSMNASNKLPLVVQGLKMLVEELNADDTISIVVYAGQSGLALPATACNEKGAIMTALDNLRAGGSTHGGEGIELAYAQAESYFVEGGINRVILATDGDFNVGVTNQGDLVSLIEEKAKSGVFLSVLGFGMGNIKDSTLEKLADKGNGYYGYIDTIEEAERVLVTQMGGTLMTIAKDVKIQVEFNPGHVSSYRLIGYENRNLRDRDFNDDTKDAGEIGAGHTVTALYELMPAGLEPPDDGVDDLKYQKPVEGSEVVESDELMTVKLRYKEPDGHVSKLMEVPVVDDMQTLREASDDFAWAAGVAGFGMLLRGSAHCSDYTYNDVLQLAESGLGFDDDGSRKAMCDLISQAHALDDRTW